MSEKVEVLVTLPINDELVLELSLEPYLDSAPS